MTARRRARSRETVAAVATGSGGVPAVLLIGRCIEVWADPAAKCPSWSAVRRFNAVRSWWLERAGVDRVEEQQRLIPQGLPWSVEYLTQAERSGQRRRGLVAERLAQGGATVDDLAALAAEANRLHSIAYLANDPRQKLRRGTR